jgi:hypothetical protein
MRDDPSGSSSGGLAIPERSASNVTVRVAH